MLGGGDDEPSFFLIFSISHTTLLLTSVCILCSSLPSTDAWMLIPDIRKPLDLGGNTDNVRIIYISVRSLLADVSLSVDLYYYSKMLGEGLRGF